MKLGFREKLFQHYRAVRRRNLRYLIRLHGWSKRLYGERRIVRFAPEMPHKAYGLWKALTYSGIRIQRGGGPAAATFYWEDATHLTVQPDPSWINARCIDVSKRRLDEVHRDVFGYNAEVDPTSALTPFVEKSDENGLHDGRLVHENRSAEPGKVYQRFIDTKDAGGVWCDYRGIVMGGRLRMWLLSKRPGDKAFGKFKLSCEILRESPLSPNEVAQVERVCEHMGLECGEVDVLRDRGDGRVYVVDVNKTCFGPNKSLPIRETLEVVRLLADDLENPYLQGEPEAILRAESYP